MNAKTIPRLFRYTTMVLTVISTCAITLHAQASQLHTATLNFDLKEVPLGDVLKNITDQTGFKFVYSDALKEIENKVSARADNERLEPFLNRFLPQQGVSHKIEGQQIALSSTSASTGSGPSPGAQSAQERQITGTVIDASDNQILVGVAVQVKGTNRVAVTDVNGKYSISAPSNGTLIFMMLGMKQTEVPVNGRTVINVSMEVSVVALEEVVITGYGQTSKRTTAASVSNVTSAELEKVTSASFQTAMQGKLAGVQIMGNTGYQGGRMDILIRGRGSLSASNNPLYIIDGMQVMSGNLAWGSVLVSTDALAGINPEDIESIDVLKDGATASIYGAQAANGVIFITTKRGKAGQAQLSAKFDFGVSNVIKYLELCNGDQWVDMTLEAYRNYSGATSATYRNQLTAFRDRGWITLNEDWSFSIHAPSTDWQKLIYRNALDANANISLRGGSNNINYYTTIGYSSNRGVVIGTDFQRITYRINMDVTPRKWVTFKTSTLLSRFEQNQMNDAGTFSNIARVAPFIVPTNVPYNEDGSFVVNLPYGSGSNGYNPLQIMALNVQNGTTTKVMSSNEFVFKITPDISFNSAYNVDYQYMKEHLFYDPRTPSGMTQNGVIRNGNQEMMNLSTSQTLTYNKVFNKRHRLNVLGGFEFRHYTRLTNAFQAVNVPTPDFKLASAAAEVTSFSNNWTEYKTVSLFGRATYTLNDKYTFVATLRRDGSSRFGDNRKFGYFPSLSLAWRIGDEPFIKKLNLFDDLKIRGGYGVTGTSAIGDFKAYPSFVASGEYLGASGLNPNRTGNPNLTWEERHSKSIAIDFAILSRRLRGSVDLYQDDTKNLLYDRPIPTISGYSSIPSNEGSLRNKGVEIQLTGTIIKTPSVSWESSINLSYNKNAITSLIDGVDEITGSYKVGESTTAVYTYRYAGVNPATGNPQFYTKNGFIKGSPLGEDRWWIAGEDPTHWGGFNNSVTWKGVNISVLFTFQKGARARNTNMVNSYGTAAAQNRNLFLEVYTDAWRKEGDITKIPRLYTATGGYRGNDRFISSESDFLYPWTDFIKLKNVNLSYTLPKKITQKLGLSAIQLTAQVNNIWTTTSYIGYDPEFRGNDYGVYPQSRNYLGSIKIDF